MGYFANGDEGDRYVETYCERCIHYGDENLPAPQCAVWDAHFVYCSTVETDGAAENVLDMLIPRDSSGNNLACRMFRPSLAEVEYRLKRAVQ